MTSKLTCSRIGNNNAPTKQYAFHCITCGITGDKFCCITCAYKCHRTHNLQTAFEKIGICNCGAQGSRMCASLLPTLCADACHDLCSFVATKKQPTAQHYYQCITCNLTQTLGICDVCAKTCHAGLLLCIELPKFNRSRCSIYWIFYAFLLRLRSWIKGTL